MIEYKITKVSRILKFKIKVRSEIVCKREKTEKRILKISLISGIIFVIIEVLMAIFSKSQSVLMDAAFDASEIIVIAVSLVLTTFLYKPITEKHPFGYAQCESLFIIVKGFMLLAVTVSLILNNIQVMFSGGSQVDTTLVSVLELILTVLSSIVLLILKYYGKKLSSPLIQAEIYGWRLDAICGFSISIAFLAPAIIESTPLAPIVPYFDQAAAILLGICMLPEPTRMVIRAFRDLLLFAPDDSTTSQIKNIIEPVCEENNLEIKFMDVIQTGRKIWVAITLKGSHENWNIPRLKQIHEQISEDLSSELEDISLEIIPSLELGENELSNTQ